MATGHYISGIGHGALLAWALIGGLFSRVPDDAIEVAEVSIISSEEFAALSAPQPSPEVEQNMPTPPAPEIAETPPEVPPPTDVTPDVVEAPPPLPEVVQPPVEDTPVVLAPPATTSSPRPAPRVAPTPVEAPPPDTEVAEEVQEAATPDAETPTPSEVDEATAPEEANERIVTEADEPASSAPTRSSRPSARPKRPDPPAETAEPATNSTRDAIADALAGVQSDDAASTQTSAPTGPPLTGGEKDAFLVDVRRCWNVGALSTAALQAKVVVRFELSREGKPDVGSIQMTGYEGGTQSVAKQAYETARRAIIRCGRTGYKLPIEKYEQWKIVNITFNPENMRLK